MPTFKESLVGNLSASNLLLLLVGTLLLGQVLSYAYGYVMSGFAAPVTYMKFGWALQYAFYLIGFYMLMRLGFTTASGGMAPHPKTALFIALMTLVIGLFLEPITASANIPMFSVVDLNLQPFAVVGLP